MPTILAQVVKLLGVTVHRIRPLPEGQLGLGVRVTRLVRSGNSGFKKFG
jgi:hypothetical protein